MTIKKLCCWEISMRKPPWSESQGIIESKLNTNKWNFKRKKIENDCYSHEKICALIFVCVYTICTKIFPFNKWVVSLVFSYISTYICVYIYTYIGAIHSWVEISKELCENNKNSEQERKHVAEKVIYDIYIAII